MERDSADKWEALDTNSAEFNEEEEIESQKCCGSTFCATSVMCCWCRHLGRGLLYNIGDKPIYTPEERETLEQEGIFGSTAQNYLSWRRSALLTMLMPLLFSLVVGVSNLVVVLHSEPNLPFVQLNTTAIQKRLNQIVFLTKSFESFLNLIAFILASVALYYWHNFVTSRKLIHFAWALYFFGPFVAGLFPYIHLFPSDAMSTFSFQVGNKTLVLTVEQITKWIPDPEIATGVVDAFKIVERLTVGFYFAGNFLLATAPAALSLPVALIRSTLFIRGLIPSTTLNGNFIKLITLLFVPLTWTLFLIFIQIVGDWHIIMSPLFYTAPAVIIVFCSSYTTPPMENKEAVKYATILRYIYLSMVLLSIIYLISMISQIPLFKGLLEELQSLGKMLELSIDFIGEYFFTAVFACDLVLSVITDDERHRLLREASGESDPLTNRNDNISQIARLFKN